MRSTAQSPAIRNRAPRTKHHPPSPLPWGGVKLIHPNAVPLHISRQTKDKSTPATSRKPTQGTLQARALPGDQPLFSPEEEDASRAANQSHKDKVLGAQLTAELKSGMALKPAKLKPQSKPRDLFEEDNAPEQGCLFARKYKNPDQLSLFDDRARPTRSARHWGCRRSRRTTRSRCHRSLTRPTRASPRTISR